MSDSYVPYKHIYRNDTCIWLAGLNIKVNNQALLTKDDTLIPSPGLSYQNLTQNFGPRRNQRDIDRGTCRRRVKSQAKWKIDGKRVSQRGLRYDWKGNSQSITGCPFSKSVASSHYSSPRCPKRLTDAPRFVSRRHQVLQ